VEHVMDVDRNEHLCCGSAVVVVVLV
jgi:hypothetical protein